MTLWPADTRGIRCVSHIDLPPSMHINLYKNFAFISHMAYHGLSIVDISDPSAPRKVGHLAAPANSNSHKVQIVDSIMVINHERLLPKNGGDDSKPHAAGLSVYDISTPTKPKHIGKWNSTGAGVHRMTFWEFPYVYVSTQEEGFLHKILVILDMSDPAQPVVVGRWWLEGQHEDENTTWRDGRRFLGDDTVRKNLHHALPEGDRLYCGWWDHGLVILDISRPSSPRFLGQTDFGGSAVNTHTACPLPGRDLVVTTDERTLDGPQSDMAYHIRLLDVSNPQRPTLCSTLPVPDPSFGSRGGRFGPHNIHEMRPGSLVDPNTVYATYFNAGLRVYDVSDPNHVDEIAFFVPEPSERSSKPAIQLNDLLVSEEGLIFVSDRVGSGMFILERT